MITIPPPRYNPLYQQVVELIEARILQGEFRVGDQLPTEKELAAMYQVSRTVIREAMKILKEKGWVETRVGKGTFVVDNVVKSVQSSFNVAIRMNSEDRFLHLIEVRLILEPEIAYLAATRASQEQIACMQQAIEQMDHAMADEIDVHEFLNGDFAFHMALAESTGNPLVRLIIDPVVTLMREFQSYYLANVKGGKRRSQSYHHLIMDAIARHDANQARRSMYEHIIQVRSDVLDYQSMMDIKDITPHSI